jgi:Putative mono-oxygenase ydhR
MVSGKTRRRRAPSVAAMHALVVTYRLQESSPAQHAELCRQLAPAFAAVPGLVSMTWLANGETGRYGGFVVLDSRAAFDRFVAGELFEALSSHHTVCNLDASEFSIDEGPTALTGGPTTHSTRRNPK